MIVLTAASCNRSVYPVFCSLIITRTCVHVDLDFSKQSFASLSASSISPECTPQTFVIKPERTLYAPQCFQISRTVYLNCFCLHCATIAFAYTNIPYLAVKVNILYRSLIFFEHHVHFQHLFFVNYNTNSTISIQKLQNGKSKITPITQRTRLGFILID